VDGQTVMILTDVHENTDALNKYYKTMNSIDVRKPNQGAILQRKAVVEERVLQVLHQQGRQTLDQLGTLLPDINWSQLFLAIDRMSRSGRISLRWMGSGDYLISTKPGSTTDATSEHRLRLADQKKATSLG
jgi:hypothetical protein